MDKQTVGSDVTLTRAEYDELMGILGVLVSQDGNPKDTISEEVFHSFGIARLAEQLTRLAQVLKARGEEQEVRCLQITPEPRIGYSDFVVLGHQKKSDDGNHHYSLIYRSSRGARVCGFYKSTWRLANRIELLMLMGMDDHKADDYLASLNEDTFADFKDRWPLSRFLKAGEGKWSLRKFLRKSKKENSDD